VTDVEKLSAVISKCNFDGDPNLWKCGLFGDIQLKALDFLSAFENQPTGFCFHLFMMIQICTYLYSSKYFPQWG